MRKFERAKAKVITAKATGADRQTGLWYGLMLMLLSLVALAQPFQARAFDLNGDARYSAIVVDAVSGEVLYAAKADSARYPASLTKIMTLYMAFDALAMGTLKPDDTITMSRNAAAQSPVKVYLKAGDTIDVDTAMRLVALYSANDLAVALAEKIGGSEERFAALMTIRAQELGMSQTRFINASGLPDPRQLSSARDMAILARSVMRDYPQYYDYFSLPSHTFRGRTYVNHNPLRSMPGVDGMKTGYTNAAGYNLVASQVKDGHRLIAVMLGGNNKSQRRDHVTTLMNTGFDIIGRRGRGEVIAVAQTEFTKAFAAARMPADSFNDGPRPYTILARNDTSTSGALSDAGLREALEASEDASGMDADVQTVSAVLTAPEVVKALTATPVVKTEAKKPEAKATAKTAKQVAAAKPAAKSAKKKKDPNAVYAIQVGAFKNKDLADDWVSNIKKRFSTALTDATSNITKSDAGWYRTRFASLTKEQAQKACSQISAKRLDCMVIKAES